MVERCWIDTGKQRAMLDSNRLVLAALDGRIEGEVDSESRIDGRVVVEAGAKLIRSVVRGPAIIGKGALVTDAYIGPYTAVGDGCVITSSELEHSIVLENSTIEDIHTRIEDSLIGRNVHLKKSGMKPRAHKLLLGDNSNVGLA